MIKRYSCYGTKLELLLDERTADAYNRVTAAFFRAQEDYEKEKGVKWTPDKTLSIDCEPDDLQVWNHMEGVFRALNEFNQFFPVDYGQPTDDFLIPLD